MLEIQNLKLDNIENKLEKYAVELNNFYGKD